MAGWGRNWKRISEFYRRMAASPAASDRQCGGAMLRLVNALAEDPAFRTIRPGLALNALRLKPGGTPRSVYIFEIFADQPGCQPGDERYTPKITTPARSVTGTLVELLAQIHHEDGATPEAR